MVTLLEMKEIPFRVTCRSRTLQGKGITSKEQHFTVVNNLLYHILGFHNKYSNIILLDVA